MNRRREIRDVRGILGSGTRDMFTGVGYLQNDRNDEATVEEEAAEEKMEEVYIITMSSFVLAVLCSFIAVFLQSLLICTTFL